MSAGAASGRYGRAMLTRDTAPNGAVVERSPLLLERGVGHAFATRLGGVSSGVYASLNFGSPMDLPDAQRDPAANVRANYARLLEAAGLAGRAVVEVHQVHGCGVHVAGGVAGVGGGGRGGASPKADAIVTAEGGVAAAVRTADCAPVLLASGDGRVVAAVHAGWRGVVGGVAAAAVRAMRERGADGIVGAIGPCIGPEHFEVGPEVVAAFREAFGAAAGRIVRREDAATGKAFVDLKEALRVQLAGAGVEGVEASEACTFREAGAFFSHRRQRGLTGRMASVIGARGA